MANELFIYLLLGLLGILVGYVMTFRSYGEKIKDVLMDLKVKGKLTNEEYDYYLRKYVERKNKAKGIFNVVGKLNKSRKKEVEEL